MISDILSAAVDGLDHYLNSPVFDSTYEGEIRQRIIACRNEMDQIRRLLDTPPAADEPEKHK